MAALFECQASLARTASVAAADLIRQAIVEGRVLPGQRLSFLIASVAFSAGYIAAGWPLIVGSGGGDSS